MTNRRCPGCGVLPGRWHVRGCDVEQCPYCGHEAIGCDSDENPIPLDDRLPWNGWWPGEREAIQFNWYCKAGLRGWCSCGKADTEAVPDLNRVRREAVWDRDRKRFVRRPRRRPTT